MDGETIGGLPLLRFELADEEAIAQKTPG